MENQNKHPRLQGGSLPSTPHRESRHIPHEDFTPSVSPKRSPPSSHKDAMSRSLPSLQPHLNSAGSSSTKKPKSARSRATVSAEWTMSPLAAKGDSNLIFQELRTSLISSPVPPTHRKLPKVLVDAAEFAVDRQNHGVNPHFHMLMDIFRAAWDNFELYAEFSASIGTGDYQLQALGTRGTTMDFSELLELLKSLNLLPEREGYSDPGSKITYSLVHDVFQAVNYQNFKEFHITSGKSGDGDKTELIFEEYKMIMLTLAVCMGLDIDGIVATSGLALEASYRKGVIGMARACKSRGVEHKCLGAPMHILRHRWMEPAKQALKCIIGANAACGSENFDRARSLAYQAERTLMYCKRPDLLGEVRMVEKQIAHKSQQASNKKRKAQVKVESMLQEAEELAYALDVTRAAELFAEADHTSLSEKLLKKGRLKERFTQTAEGLQCAERAIEGDLKLDLAWEAIQNDDLNDAKWFLEEAKRCYGGIPMRMQELQHCQEAYQRKKDSEKSIRERGSVYVRKAKEEMAVFRFDQSSEAIDCARKEYSQWLVPVARNQSLIEKLTTMLHKVWNNRALYDMYSAHDATNLSGQGVRASTMDFNEMLYMLRALGILATKKVLADDVAVPMSRAEQHMRQQQLTMIDTCTFEEIRANPFCKLTKADIYEEFRAVNRQSAQLALHGNDEADDDVSSLDWSEYQLLMLRIGKLLGVAVTDQACSPLFLKDMHELEALREELAAVKKEYMQGIIHQGEKIMMQARNYMQEKLFEEARTAIQHAHAEFMRIQEDNLQRINVATCKRLAEQVEKEEKKELARREDQRASAEQAARQALAILEEFDQLGARFDEHMFDMVERGAENALKMFKSAQAYNAEKKELVTGLQKRCQQARDSIMSLRKAVIHGRDQLDSGKVMLQQFHEARASQNVLPPYEAVLDHLVKARGHFIKAKVVDELEDTIETLNSLTSQALGWIKMHVEAGEALLRSAEQALADAVVAAETDAVLTEDRFSAAHHCTKDAAKQFQHARVGDCILAFLAAEGDESVREEDQYRDEWTAAVRAKIVEMEEKWRAQREREVEEGHKEVVKCHECIARIDFVNAREHLRVMRALFKKREVATSDGVLAEIKQAEAMEKLRASFVRDEGNAHMSKAVHMRKHHHYAQALDLVEMARVCFVNARDAEMEEVAKGTRKSILQDVRKHYLEQVAESDLHVQHLEIAISSLRFDDARCLVERSHALVHDETHRSVLTCATQAHDDMGVVDEEVESAYAMHDALKGTLSALEARAADEERHHVGIQTLRAHVGSCLAHVVANHVQRDHAPHSAHELASLRARCELVRALTWPEGTPVEEISVPLARLEQTKRENDEKFMVQVQDALRQASIAIGVPPEEAQTLSVDHSAWISTVVEAGKAAEDKSLAHAHDAGAADAQAMVGADGDVAVHGSVADHDHQAPDDAHLKRSPSEESPSKGTSRRTESSEARDHHAQLLLQQKQQRDSILQGDSAWEMIIPTEDGEGEDDNSAPLRFDCAYNDTGVRMLVDAARMADKAGGVLDMVECAGVLTARARAWCTWIKQRVHVLAREEMQTYRHRVGSGLDKGKALVADRLFHDAETALQEAESVPEVPEQVLFAVMVPHSAEYATWMEEVRRIKDQVAAFRSSAHHSRDDKVRRVKGLATTLVDEAEFSAGQAEFEAALEQLAKAFLLLNEEKDEAYAELIARAERVKSIVMHKKQNWEDMERQLREAQEDTMSSNLPIEGGMLHVLASSGRVAELIGCLKRDHGTSLHQKDASGRTPLMQAAAHVHDDCIRALLQYGAKVNDTDSEGYTPLALYVCAKNGTPLGIRLLLRAGADRLWVNGKDGRTCVHMCAMWDRGDQIEELMHCLVQGEGAGEGAMGEGDQVEMQREFDQHHSEFDQKNDDDGDDDEMWSKSCSILDQADREGSTPLMLAVRSGSALATCALLSCGSNPRTCDARGINALHIAAQEGAAEAIIKVLCQGMKEVDDPVLLGGDIEGGTPLMIAAHHSKVDAVNLFLGLRADAARRDKAGRTVMHAAAVQPGGMECVRVLIERGGREVADAVDVDGLTPTYHAVCTPGCFPNASLICPDGLADHRTPCGHTLLYAASHFGVMDSVTSLLEARCDPSEPSGDAKSSPLIAACARGHLHVVKALLSAGADARWRDERGMNAVHHCVMAAASGAVSARDCLRCVLEKGKQILVDVCNQGCSPLHLAVLLGDASTVKILVKAGGETLLRLPLGGSPDAHIEDALHKSPSRTASTSEAHSPESRTQSAHSISMRRRSSSEAVTYPIDALHKSESSTATAATATEATATTATATMATAATATAVSTAAEMTQSPAGTASTPVLGATADMKTTTGGEDQRLVGALGDMIDMRKDSTRMMDMDDELGANVYDVFSQGSDAVHIDALYMVRMCAVCAADGNRAYADADAYHSVRALLKAPASANPGHVSFAGNLKSMIDQWFAAPSSPPAPRRWSLQGDIPKRGTLVAGGLTSVLPSGWLTKELKGQLKGEIDRLSALIETAEEAEVRGMRARARALRKHVRCARTCARAGEGASALDAVEKARKEAKAAPYAIDYNYRVCEDAERAARRDVRVLYLARARTALDNKKVDYAWECVRTAKAFLRGTDGDGPARDVDLLEDEARAMEIEMHMEAVFSMVDMLHALEQRGDARKRALGQMESLRAKYEGTGVGVSRKFVHESISVIQYVGRELDAAGDVCADQDRDMARELRQQRAALITCVGVEEALARAQTSISEATDPLTVKIARGFLAHSRALHTDALEGRRGLGPRHVGEVVLRAAGERIAHLTSALQNVEDRLAEGDAEACVRAVMSMVEGRAEEDASKKLTHVIHGMLGAAEQHFVKARYLECVSSLSEAKLALEHGIWAQQIALIPRIVILEDRAKALRVIQAKAEEELDKAFTLLHRGDLTASQTHFMAACAGLREARDARPAVRERVLAFRQSARTSSVESRLTAVIWDTARRTVRGEHAAAQAALHAAYRKAEALCTKELFEEAEQELLDAVQAFGVRMSVWGLAAEGAPDPRIVVRGGKQMQARVAVDAFLAEIKDMIHRRTRAREAEESLSQARDAFTAAEKDMSEGRDPTSILEGALALIGRARAISVEAVGIISEQGFARRCDKLHDSIVTCTCTHTLTVLCEDVRVRVEQDMRDATYAACVAQRERAMHELVVLCAEECPHASAFEALRASVDAFVRTVEGRDGGDVVELKRIVAHADHVGKCVALRVEADAAFQTCSNLVDFDVFLSASETLEFLQVALEQLMPKEAQETKMIVDYPVSCGPNLCAITSVVKSTADLLKEADVRMADAAQELSNSLDRAKQEMESSEFVSALESLGRARACLFAVSGEVRVDLTSEIDDKHVKADRGRRVQELQRRADAVEVEVNALVHGGKFDKAKEKALEALRVRAHAMAVSVEGDERPPETPPPEPPNEVDATPPDQQQMSDMENVPDSVRPSGDAVEGIPLQEASGEDKGRPGKTEVLGGGVVSGAGVPEGGGGTSGVREGNVEGGGEAEQAYEEAFEHEDDAGDGAEAAQGSQGEGEEGYEEEFEQSSSGEEERMGGSKG